jgi:hypothetical protein
MSMVSFVFYYFICYNNKQFFIKVANSAFFNATNVIDLACNWYDCNPNDLVKAFNSDHDGYSFMNEFLIGNYIFFTVGISTICLTTGIRVILFKIHSKLIQIRHGSLTKKCIF